MIKEEARKQLSYNDMSSFSFELNQALLDTIYDDFESQTCKNCKYLKDESTTFWCNNMYIQIEKDFGCNRFERK